MASYQDLISQINDLKGQLSELVYENHRLSQRWYNKQRGFGFMGPYTPCPTCPAGIAQPAEGARRFGFMGVTTPTAHSIPARVPAEMERFGFMAPYPASPGNPTPTDIEFGFMGYPLAPTYTDYGHPRMIQRYGFMDIPGAEVITEHGKPEQFRKYGFMTQADITSRFFR